MADFDKLEPDAIAGQSFTAGRRGFDQDEVRAFLVVIAGHVRGVLEALETAETRAAEAEGKLAGDLPLDEVTLAAAVGEETARFLQVAKESAAAIETKAQERAAGIVREADERGYAEGVARAGDVTAAAERRLADVDVELAALRSEARREAEAEGAELIAEARAVRDKVLGDLARRRTAAKTQVEQLYAARERLLSSLADVRRAVEEATANLTVALPEAKLAADAAARRVQAEPELTIADLEGEIEALRIAGIELLPTPDEEPVDEPVVEVDSPPADSPEDLTGDVVLLPTTTPDDSAAPVPQSHEPALPAPELPPAPESPPAPERRSSALRVFRAKREQSPITGLPEGEMHQVDASAEFEGITLLPAEPAAPIPEWPVEPASEPEPEVAAEPEPEAAPEPEPDAVAELPAPPTEEVDALFERLKAGRAEKVADARKVIAEERQAEPDVDLPAAEPVSEPAAEPAESTTTGEVHVHVGGGVDRVQLLARRDEVVREPSAALTRRLKRLLVDEQNEVLDRLRRAGEKATVEVVLPEDDHASRWAQAAAPDLALAAAAGGRFNLGESVHIPEPTPTELADLADELAAAVAAPMRERIETTLRSAAGDADFAADGIRSAYRDWKARRIGEVAEHFTLAAFARGVVAAAPTRARMCWVVDDGGTPCPDAEDNSLAGAVTKGEPFPTGDLLPPAHAGCRCLLVVLD